MPGRQAFGDGAARGVRGVGEDHVHAPRTQSLHRRAGAGEEPRHLRIIRRREPLGQRLQQAELARRAGREAEALATLAPDSGGLRCGAGLGHDGRRPESAGGHRHEAPPPHDVGSGWAAFGKNNCSPLIL